MASDNKRPVQDEGEPYRERPFHVGGSQGELSARKNALMNTGSTGFIPRGTGRAGHVHEAPPPPRTPGDELEPGPRPHPREIPVHSQTTHMGNIVRYLDGHTEIHRERPELVELLGNPHLHPDDKDEIRQEIAHRDAIHLHKY